MPDAAVGPCRCVMLGCGVVGALTGARLLAAGWTVVGVRRTPWARSPDEPVPAFPVLAGGIFPAGSAQAVVVAANPGIRRGRDNGVAALVQAACARWPSARLVVISTTSLYGDAAGAGVDETAAVAATPEATALRAIETAAEGHADHLVLRATALVGPTRTFARSRVAAAVAAGQPVVVAGDPERPFSYVHDDDLADIVALAVQGGLGCGVLNVAVPQPITVAAYYRALGARTVIGDGTPQPRRWIDARRLAAWLPGRRWRLLDGLGSAP